ncbi:MAG: hypothetical protein AB1324_06675 [Candidatus Micrarchaeota archaeon]
MGSSRFMLSAGKNDSLKAQYREVKDAFGDAALMVSGPYRDAGRRVEGIAEDIRSSMKWQFFRRPIDATMAALSPRNMFPRGKTALEVPFALSSRPLHTACDSAGDVAGAETEWMEGKAHRVVDLASLDLLAVAVLRRLGIPSLLAYAHPDRSDPAVVMLDTIAAATGQQGVRSTPCIIALEREPVILNFIPPFSLELGSSGWVHSVEALDSDAVLSIMRLRSAHRHARKLMGQVADGALLSIAEGRILSASIAHTLFDGIGLWSCGEAEGAARAAGRARHGRDGVVSIRELAESEHVHTLTCPIHRAIEASGAILCESAKEELSAALGAVIRGERVPQEELSLVMSSHPCVLRLAEYGKIAESMDAHMHPAKGCEDVH